MGIYQTQKKILADTTYCHPDCSGDNNSLIKRFCYWSLDLHIILDPS